MLSRRRLIVGLGLGLAVLGGLVPPRALPTRLRAADRTAILVAPNILNWDQTCTNCAGFPSGHSWSEEFLASYQSRYGPLPVQAWGIHVYSADWLHLPLANAPVDQAELAALRS